MRSLRKDRLPDGPGSAAGVGVWLGLGGRGLGYVDQLLPHPVVGKTSTGRSASRDRILDVCEGDNRSCAGSVVLSVRVERFTCGRGPLAAETDLRIRLAGVGGVSGASAGTRIEDLGPRGRCRVRTETRLRLRGMLPHPTLGVNFRKVEAGSSHASNLTPVAFDFTEL